MRSQQCERCDIPLRLFQAHCPLDVFADTGYDLTAHFNYGETNSILAEENRCGGHRAPAEIASNLHHPSLKTNCNPQVVTAKAKAKAGDKRSALMAIKRKNQWIAQQTQARR
jgi:hypothetical protein